MLMKGYYIPNIGGGAPMRNAFTLIELLVVITIIAILAAILFPVFARAREKARQVACYGNLRQIGMAFQMYLQDNDGYFPPVAWTFGRGGRWLRFVLRYRSDMKISACPSAPERDRAIDLRSYRYDRDIGYGYNYIYLGDSRGQFLPFIKGRFPVHEASIGTPSHMIMVADSDGTAGYFTNPRPYNPDGSDCGARGHHGFQIDPPTLPANIPPCYPARFCSGSIKPGHCRISNRHNGGANVCFVDGHVKWMRRENLERDNRYWNGRYPDPNP